MYILFCREYLAGERIQTDLHEYIPELLPERIASRVRRGRPIKRRSVFALNEESLVRDFH